MAMTTEQMLLLNNLMYSGSRPKNGQSVGEWLTSIDVKGSSSGTSQEQWDAMINTIREDPELMNLTVADCHTDPVVDGKGGGKSVLFLNEQSKEAVVVFQGTDTLEWKDNFDGGGITDGADGVSTKLQENALDWYKEQYQDKGLSDYDVTVTGHSKGGNKAKYITLLDDTVDHCVSFDGQGFSDEFINEYSDRIALNQSKIHNHNVDSDYVNLLLNDVGESTFYYPYDIGDGKFIENHYPDTFFKRDSAGKLKMVVNPNGQSKEMKALDQFLNSCLRSVNAKDKQEMLNTIGSLVEAATSGGDDAVSSVMNELSSDPQKSMYIGYILSYMVKYQQENPELMESVKSALSKAGMSDIVKIVSIAQYLMEHDLERHLLELGVVGVDVIAHIAKIINCDISTDELDTITRLLSYMEGYLPGIQIKDDDGADKKVGSGAGGIPADFHVYTGTIRGAGESLNGISKKLDGMIRDSEDILNTWMLYNIIRLGKFKKAVNRIRSDQKRCQKLQKTLESVSSLYERYEEKILNNSVK